MKSAETSDEAPIPQPAQSYISCNWSIFLGRSTPAGCGPTCEIFHWHVAGEPIGKHSFSPSLAPSYKLPITETEMGHFALIPSGKWDNSALLQGFLLCASSSLGKPSELPAGSPVTSSPKLSQQVPRHLHLPPLLQNTSFTKWCLWEPTPAGEEHVHNDLNQLYLPSSKWEHEGLVSLESLKSMGRKKTTFRNPHRRISKKTACFTNYLCYAKSFSLFSHI